MPGIRLGISALVLGGQSQGKALLCLFAIPGGTLFETATVGN